MVKDREKENYSLKYSLKPALNEMVMFYKLYYYVCWCGFSPLLLIMVIYNNLDMRLKTEEHFQGRNSGVYFTLFRGGGEGG